MDAALLFMAGLAWVSSMAICCCFTPHGGLLPAAGATDQQAGRTAHSHTSLLVISRVGIVVTVLVCFRRLCGLLLYAHLHQARDPCSGLRWIYENLGANQPEMETEAGKDSAV